MKILWAGWGDLGARATPALVGAGHSVVALRRSPIMPVPDGVTPLISDLNAPDGLSLPTGIDTCIITLTPDTRDRAGYESAYVAGVANLQLLLESYGGDTNAQPLRVVFASSTAVYGQNDGSWVEESASTSPSRFNGEVIQRAEQQLLAHDGTHGVVARLGGIYGPGRDRLIRSVRNQERSSATWTNRIHSDDAAAALAHLAMADRALVPDVVNVVDRLPARKVDVTDFIAHELGVPAPPATNDQADTGKRVDGSRLVTTNFVHTFPTFREGYRDVIAAL